MYWPSRGCQIQMNLFDMVSARYYIAINKVPNIDLADLAPKNEYLLGCIVECIAPQKGVKSHQDGVKSERIHFTWYHIAINKVPNIDSADSAPKIKIYLADSTQH